MSEVTPEQQPPQPETPPSRVLAKDDPSLWNDLEQRIVGAIKTVYDPEIPVDIWELGLIYAVRSADDGHVEVDMTLTSPMCPAAGSMPPEVQRKVSALQGVMACAVEVVWDPPWTPAMMTEAARLELNIPT